MGPKSEDLPGQIEKFLMDLGFGDGNIQIGETKVLMHLMSACVILFVYASHGMQVL